MGKEKQATEITTTPTGATCKPNPIPPHRKTPNIPQPSHSGLTANLS
jgi:hypothetical protein